MLVTDDAWQAEELNLLKRAGAATVTPMMTMTAQSHGQGQGQVHSATTRPGPPPAWAEGRAVNEGYEEGKVKSKATGIQSNLDQLLPTQQLQNFQPITQSPQPVQPYPTNITTGYLPNDAQYGMGPPSSSAPKPVTSSYTLFNNMFRRKLSDNFNYTIPAWAQDESARCAQCFVEVFKRLIQST